MKELKQDTKKVLTFASAVLVLYLIIRYWGKAESLVKLGIGAATPLLVGCVMAYVINILMTLYENCYKRLLKQPFARKIERFVCMIFAFVSLFGIVYLIINLVLPELLNCIAAFINMIPSAIQMLIDFIGEERLMELLPYLEEQGIEFDINSISKQIEQILTTVVSGVGGAVGSIVSVVSGTFSIIMNVVIGLIFAIYVLLDKEELGKQCKMVVRTYLPKQADGIFYVLKVVDESFRNFIVGQCIEAVILGSLCAIGMSILGFPYAVMIGVFIGFTALIPIAGAYIGAGVGVVMILMTDPIQALQFLAFILILQQVEGNLIYPRVVGQSIGLPGIWVLTAITIGGGIMGVMGMLVAVPVFASVYRLVKEDIARRNRAIEERAKAEHVAEGGCDVEVTGKAEAKCNQETKAEDKR
uniref:AI-2E family transporter n=1 Tax=Agathobacter sp. TaxID=2021311 RepID=UPI004057B3E3